MRGMGRKFFVGLIAPLIAVALAVPVEADTDNQDDLFNDYLNETLGISIDQDAAVDMAKTACEAPRAGIGLSNAWDEMGQRYPEYDINTIARVMSAANLAYCPDRLP
jgi:hypothetical protein